MGAFFAGLALNRLVSSRAEDKERFEFVGAALLVPFFLLSTGMLLDPRQFTEPSVLVLAGASFAIVLVGKAVAAYISGRRSGFGRSEISSSSASRSRRLLPRWLPSRSAPRPGSSTRTS